MGWGLFQEVPECPECHYFPFECPAYFRELKEKDGREQRMNQPMTLCISFLLRDKSQVLPHGCSLSLWPPEGRGKSLRSVTALISSDVQCRAESRTRLDASPGLEGESWRCREATLCSKIELWPEC